MSLWIDVSPGDKVHVGNDMTITVERKARLRFCGAAQVRRERPRVAVTAPVPTNPDGHNPPRVETGD